MIIYNKSVQLLDDSIEKIDFLINETEAIYHIDLKLMNNQNLYSLGNCILEDQVLMRKEFKDYFIVVYIKSEEVLATKVSIIPNEAFRMTEKSFEIGFESLSPLLIYKQTSEISFSIYNASDKYLFSIHDLMTYDKSEYVYPIDLELQTTDYRFLLLGKIKINKFYAFVLYDLFRKEIVTKKVLFSVNSNEGELDYKLTDPDVLEISDGKDTAVINFKKVSGKGKKIFDFYQLAAQRDTHLLGNLTINEIKYFVHNKTNGVYLTRANAIKVFGFLANLKVHFSNKNLYIYGRNTHYAYKANGKYDYLYITGNEKPISKFVRPLDIAFFRRYGFFKVPLSSITKESDKRYNFYLGNQKESLHLLRLKPGVQKARVLAIKKSKTKVNLIRTAKNGNISTITSFEPEKFTYAKRISNWISNLKNKKEVLKLFRILFVLLGRMPRKEKLVIFESFHAKQYSDSPRAIYEYMKVHHPDYRLLWSIDKQVKNIFDDFQVPYIRRFTLKWFLLFPRAKYWVNNVRLPGWMPKPQDTVYVQTWHGTPLKKLGVDIDEIHMPGTSTTTYKKNFVRESRKWSYLVSPNAYSTEIFKRAFHYQGEVIESGYPRNDILSNHSNTLISSLKQKLGISEDKKIMLYAPTWRDNEFYQKGKYKFEFQFDLENWKKEYGEEWVLLSRMHYLVAENFDFSLHEGIVYDVSSYPDIRDLYLISDLMITDYSSVFFDYAILNRPIVFFMYDLEKYRDQLRGFYIDIEKETPGPIVQTEEELFQAINKLIDSNVQLDSKFSAFKNKFSLLEDGHATERVVKAFLK